jgi:menaquinone-dependent protoporphyrinogen oxidase
MKPVLVLYATREGHTRKIAENAADAIRNHGFAAELVDAAQISGGFSLDKYSAALLIASVHRARHEPEMRRFAKSHRAGLERIPAAFLSVSWSEAGAEDTTAPPERRAQAEDAVRRMIDNFLAETQWRPARIKAVAGALLYSKYNFLLRLVMKRIARQAGGATDTSRDWEYTDWQGLDRFVEEFVQSIPLGAE